MLKKLYIGLFDFGPNGNTPAYEFLEGIVKDKNKDYSNFVVVEAVSEDDAKRKIFNSTRKLDIEDNEDVANFIISLYDQNIDNSKYFSTLEKVYEKHIGGEPITDLYDMPISKRKALIQDISTLDKSVLNEIHFWLCEEDIYITDKFKQITD
ncbi:hypothetical protein NNL84_06990 [Enterococcus faecium]|nr:hypothetical protein [Enterococcus faecium]